MPVLLSFHNPLMGNPRTEGYASPTKKRLKKTLYPFQVHVILRFHVPRAYRCVHLDSPLRAQIEIRIGPSVHFLALRLLTSLTC